METVNLYTRDGGYVTTVIAPQFKPKAEVILWGSRTFVWSNGEQKYLEGLCYVVTEPPVIVMNNIEKGEN